MNDEIKEIFRRMNDLIEHRFDKEYHTECDLFKDIQELLDYITNLQEENEFLKLNNPEMNIEHFRIVKENKRKIDNLRKENEELKSKNDILEFRMKQNDKMVICERYRILKQRDDYKQRVDEAIEYIKNHQPVFSMWNKKQISKWFDEEFYKELLDILNGDSNEKIT